VFDEDPIAPALFLVLFCGGTNIFIDMYVYRVYLRPSTGLDFAKYNPSLSRSVIKCLGLVGTFGLLFFLYWVLPEYNGDYYNNYYDMMELVLPIMVPFAAGYIYYVDAHMKQPCDGLYSMGLAMTCRWESVNTALLSQYLLGWMVKGFFMPLMFVPLCDDIQNLLTTNFRDVVTWGDLYGYLYSFLYFIDLHFANIGYMCTFRLCDTHIRATESTLVGWVAALMCYSPINTITSFYFDYSNDITWSTWLEGYPVVAFMWGSSILILTALYSLAGVYFGIRFSNLTHRGIITSGPYAITKHPAYLFKNISWWMVSVPFAAQGGWEVALKNSIGLLMFNVSYVANCLDRSHYESWKACGICTTALCPDELPAATAFSDSSPHTTTTTTTTTT
jgi:protein-S-isoprenylcysteine O-methyltransferase Ste14